MTTRQFVRGLVRVHCELTQQVHQKNVSDEEVETQQHWNQIRELQACQRDNLTQNACLEATRRKLPRPVAKAILLNFFQEQFPVHLEVRPIMMNTRPYKAMPTCTECSRQSGTETGGPETTKLGQQCRMLPERLPVGPQR